MSLVRGLFFKISDRSTRIRVVATEILVRGCPGTTPVLILLRESRLEPLLAAQTVSPASLLRSSDRLNPPPSACSAHDLASHFPQSFLVPLYLVPLLPPPLAPFPDPPPRNFPTSSSPSRNLIISSPSFFSSSIQHPPSSLSSFPSYLPPPLFLPSKSFNIFSNTVV
jgi:hypothetical protein